MHIDSSTILRWETFCTESPLSLRQISREIGRHEGYLATLFMKARKGISVNPDTNTVASLASVLKLHTDDLLGMPPTFSIMPQNDTPTEYEKQAAVVLTQMMSSVPNQMAAQGRRASMEQVISWYVATGGILSGDEDILDSCDLYEVPAADAETLTAVSVGLNSLTTMTMHRADPSVLKELMECMQPGDRLALVASYRAMAAQDSIQLTGPHTISITPHGYTAPYPVTYMRLTLPVKTRSDIRMLLTYSFPCLPPGQK
jgi:hypothetical protein